MKLRLFLHAHAHAQACACAYMHYFEMCLDTWTHLLKALREWGYRCPCGHFCIWTPPGHELCLDTGWGFTPHPLLEEKGYRLRPASFRLEEAVSPAGDGECSHGLAWFVSAASLAGLAGRGRSRWGAWGVYAPSGVWGNVPSSAVAGLSAGGDPDQHLLAQFGVGDDLVDQLVVTIH